MHARRPDARIRIAAALGLVAAVVTALVTSRSDVLYLPGLNAALRTVLLLTAVGVALVSWSRRPGSRLGLVLLGIGAAFAVTTLQAWPQPLLYSTGRLMLPVCTVGLLYAFLAFPSGRLPDRGSRRAIAISAAGIGLAWLLTALVESPLPTAGLLSSCQGACPDNPLQLVAGSPGLSEAAALAVAGAQTTGVCLVAIALVTRLRTATPVERVTLGGALVPLVAVAAVFALAFVLRALGLDGAADDLGWLYAPLLGAIAVALLVGQVRGRLFAGAALRRMLSELGPHPSPAAMERHMAVAFGDPTLRVAYWSAERGGYLDASGAPLVVPDAPGPGTAELWDGNERVAVILHDRALDEVPGLMDAAGAATLLTVRNARLNAELRSSIHALRASRARIAAAVDGARRALEHDLAQGAQLRLDSVRARLVEAAGAADEPAPRAVLADLRTAADQAAETLADAAHGIYPRQLVAHGLAPALGSRLGAARALVVRGPLQRGPDETEAAVFFSCLEAVQNALKHAGQRSTVTVTLEQQGRQLRFAVHDDGDGFDVPAAGHGRGLANIRDRIDAVGGCVAISSGHGHGTTISGHVPWPPAAPRPE